MKCNYTAPFSINVYVGVMNLHLKITVNAVDLLGWTLYVYISLGK